MLHEVSTRLPIAYRKCKRNIRTKIVKQLLYKITKTVGFSDVRERSRAPVQFKQFNLAANTS